MKSNSYLSRLLVALLTLLPMTAVAQEQTQLAKWTFETGYTVDDNVYTPNTDAWAAIGWNGFGTLPRILPNEFNGNQNDYYVSAKGTRFWGIQENYDAKIMSLYQDKDPNSITDYTDASQHNQYFEIGFPTKGYKNVQFTFAYTCGDNKERSMEMVVSTDGGQTWSDAGGYVSGATWWTYKTNTVTLSANNKDQVIVRLIAPNGETAQWRMNEISIAGEAAAGPVAVSEKDFTATWTLKDADIVSNATTSKDGLFAVAGLTWGDKLQPAGLRTDGGVTRQQFQPTETANADDDAAALTFTLKPKKSLKFTPKKLSFNASRVGTNGGKFDVVVISGTQSAKVGEGITPQLAKEEPYVSLHEYDLSGIAATDDVFYVKIYIYNLANNKQYAFSDVVISGDVEGTLEAIPTYTMSVKVGTEGAGSVSCTPAGTEFDEGTTLTVKAVENFGYHFQSWTDEAGNVVSTDNPYTFDIKANTSLIATYNKSNVYALNVKREGGANENLVQFLPEGNYVDGVHYYEEGTEVKLTALNNRILTFTGWEDNSTEAERVVTVNETMNLTANFSAIDFIVGWDFYNDNPKSNRAADYMADTENAGIMTVRQADGTTSTWLANGVAAGKANGRYCIRIWKPIADKWYYEFNFSSKGYQNLKLSAALGDDYNAYSVMKAEYSIDGTNFTQFGTYELPNRGWKDGEFDLPAEANDQNRVYIRFIPDYDSPKVGVEDSRDGTMLTDVFVLADATGAASEVATLVSSNPAQNATGVSANGSVILTFDNKVKAGTGTATLNGEQIVPIVSGKSAIFKYAGLDYNTAYTFEMPAGVLTSRSGNAVAATNISFTTMERKQPAAKVFDAVVAADGSGDYKTVQEAVDAAPTGRGTPWLIFIKNGIYNEHVDVPKAKSYLHFIGQDRDGVVIKDNRLSGGDNAVHVSIGATVVVNADNIFFENLTMENSYGHEKQAGPQALALNTVGDRIALNHVALLSYQDTWITTSTQKNRHYIKNSLIEGAVDFIYNGGDVYLDGDTLEINRPSGGYIVAPWHTADTKWGYVFQNNVIRQHPGVNVTDVWLGRPWHGEPKTVFINTQTYVPIPAKGWYNFMGGLPVIWAEYNTVDKDGNPLDLSQRENYYYTYYGIIDGKEKNINADSYNKLSDADKAKYTLLEHKDVKNTLTAEEAAQYTIKNVMGGSDGWQPDVMCEPCDAPVVKGANGQLTWEAVPYAICYVVTKNGVVAGFTKDTTFDGYTDGDSWQVQAVNEYGGLSEKATPNAATAIRSVKTKNEDEDENENGNAIFTLDGRQVSLLQHGLNIVRMSDGAIKKVLVK